MSMEDVVILLIAFGLAGVVGFYVTREEKPSDHYKHCRELTRGTPYEGTDAAAQDFIVGCLAMSNAR